jgi:ribosomal protein S18 acetylase RimI-like enzyme
VPGAFRIEVLSTQHDRAAFSCGVEPLDRYLREQATQDIRRRVSACYVAIDATASCIAGYYTLAAGGVPLVEMPPALAKRLPRYASVPVVRMGRLAVDERYRGRKLGAALLWDAVLRATRSEIAAFALVVDAKDAAAAAFYQRHGFVTLTEGQRQWILPLARVNETSK